MKRKMMWLITSLLVLACLVITACSPAAPAAPQLPTSPTAGAVTIAPAAAKETIIRWRPRPGNQAEHDAYQAINTELNQKLSAQGFQLQYDPAPTQGYVDQFLSEQAAGNLPDIVWMDGANFGDAAAQGYALDLSSLVNADARFTLGAFNAAAVRELQQGGKLWGLPADISTLVMYYNKDLFRAKGLEDPASLAAKGQWNWDTFRSAALALTDPAAKQYGFALNNDWGPWGWFVLSGGGSFYNSDRTTCNLTDPGSIAGLQYMSDLFSKDHVGPPPNPQNENEFHAGSIAMFPNGRWMTPRMRQDGFDWGVVEMPEGPAGKRTWLFWNAYLINARSQHPDLAWLALKELTSPEVQARLAQLGSIMPARTEVSVQDAFLNSRPPSDNSPFTTGLNYAQSQTALFTGKSTAVRQAYQTAVDRIEADRATPMDAASEACNTANPLLR